MQDFKEKENKREERKRKDEEFLAAKEAKLKLEIEAKKQKNDDLRREKEKIIQKQHLELYKKQVKKCEDLLERQSFLEFFDVVKQKCLENQLREAREREFEYAQLLGGK